jgi:phosphoribosylanthranilate isomerase
MTWVKICGTTNLEDANAALEAGADALGFIFAESPRRIAPDEAKRIIRQLPAPIEKVGVFVNETPERMHQVIEEAGLTAVQLQGEETAAIADELKRLSTTRRGRLHIFKAVGVAKGIEGVIRDFAASPSIDGILLDSFAARAAGQIAGEHKVARGGTGKTFDWKRAEAFVPGLAQRTRVIIAGGLSPANVTEAILMLNPWGVDVCSGVEAAPGHKDVTKVRAFVKAARSAGQRGTTSSN